MRGDRGDIRGEIEKVDRELEKLEAEEEERHIRQSIELEEDIAIWSKMMRWEPLEAEEEEPTPKEKTEKKKKDKEEEDEEKFVPASTPTPTQPAITYEPPATVAPSGLGSTGRGRPEKTEKPIAKTAYGVAKEAMIRRWDQTLKAQSIREGTHPNTVYRRMWLLSNLKGSLREQMMEELHGLEDTSKHRCERIAELEKQDRRGTLDEKSEKELTNLEREEARRYLLREKLLPETPLKQQREMSWIQPIEDSAMGVQPYTFLTTWSMMSNKDRKIYRWYADNVLLRWQHTIVGRFMPKKAHSVWFKRQLRGQYEAMFEDMDEEIYMDKKFKKEVKDFQKQLEDMEEELRGYNRFTVEEEKKIEKMYTEELKKLQEAAKLQEAEYM